MRTKSAVRKKILKKLREQTKEERLRKGRTIKKKIFSLKYFKEAKNIFCFISLKSEVDTREIIIDALKQGKSVFAPRVEQDALRIAEVKDLDKDLEEGPLGVLQPKKSCQPLSSPESLDIAIIPGLAFDEKGVRLGRGKGYFDRFLSQLAGATKTVGIAFDFQILKTIPQDPHDIPVNLVITDN